MAITTRLPLDRTNRRKTIRSSISREKVRTEETKRRTEEDLWRNLRKQVGRSFRSPSKNRMNASSFIRRKSIRLAKGTISDQEMLVPFLLAVEISAVRDDTGLQNRTVEEMVSADVRHVRNLDRDIFLFCFLDDDRGR